MTSTPTFIFISEPSSVGVVWLTIVLKHPPCSECYNFPCTKMKDGVQITAALSRGQLCGGLEFKHRGCYNNKGEKVRDLQFYPKLIADDIMCDYHFATVGDVIYVYRDGLYVPEGEKIIMSETQQRLRDDIADQSEQNKRDKTLVKDKVECTTYRKNEVVNYIRDGTHIVLAGYPKPQPPHIINMKNGLFDLNTWELGPHTPDIFSVSQIPVAYNPPIAKVEGAKCPAITKFISEILDEKDIPAILELFGYCIFPDYPIHKTFVFQGEGRNGKTTILNLLRAFIGDDNCSTVALQQLSDANRFAKADLFGKLANIYDDLPDTALRDTGTFKMATGQSKIRAEFKFKDGFDFRNYAKMIFSCNRLPLNPDDTDAMYARFYIIEFTRQFLGEKADKELIKKLTTKEELEGLLLVALKYLKSLTERGEFSNTPTIEEMRRKYTILSDSVGAFVDDCLETDSDADETKTLLYSAYTSYCREKHYRIVNDNTFHKRLKALCDVETSKKKIGVQRVNVWVGVRLKRVSEDVRGEKVSSDTVLSSRNLEDVRGVNGISDPLHTCAHTLLLKYQKSLDTLDTLSKICVNPSSGKNTPEGVSRVSEDIGANTENASGVSRVFATNSDHCVGCGKQFEADEDGGLTGLCDDCFSKRMNESREREYRKYKPQREQKPDNNGSPEASGRPE